MSGTLKPRDTKDVEAAVQWAVAEGKALELVGHGSKRALGRPAQTDLTLDLSALSGVTLYEPEELVLSAKAGTSPSSRWTTTRSSASSPVAARSGARSPPTSRVHAGSRPAPRATISWG